MERIFVKINRDSIRKNENAGRTSDVLLGGKTCYFKCTQVVFDRLNLSESDFDWIDLSTDLNAVNKYLLNNLDKISMLSQTPGVEIEINRQFEEINFMPEPEYFYEYDFPEGLSEDDILEMDFYYEKIGDVLKEMGIE